jgi:mevalonate kinase
MVLGTGSGFGKTIFVGDAFLHFNAPAIVAALSHTTVVEVAPRPEAGWTMEDLRPEVPGYKRSKLDQQRESIDRVFAAMGIDVRRQGLHIVFRGDLLAGSGIGASAAGCVALARALNDQCLLARTETDINAAALEGEKAYHGDPSGVDNTASTFGGVLWFQRDPGVGRYGFEALTLGAPLDIVLANSGVNVDTSRVVAFKKRQIEEHPDAYHAALNATHSQAHALRSALAAADKAAIGRLMDDHHRVLRGLSFSHEKIERIIAVARQEGALGAKVTGGGMGGYTLILAEDEEHQARIARAVRADGFHVLATRIVP